MDKIRKYIVENFPKLVVDATLMITVGIIQVVIQAVII